MKNGWHPSEAFLPQKGRVELWLFSANLDEDIVFRGTFEGGIFMDDEGNPVGVTHFHPATTEPPLPPAVRRN